MNRKNFLFVFPLVAFLSSETVDSDGEVRRFFPEKEWTPTPADLTSFKGDWFSEESGATFTVAIEADKAYIKQRPATSLLMQPLYKDHFGVQGYVVWFTRDKMERSIVCT
jgi:hypothetical protein